MGVLYFASDLDLLADRLAEELDRSAKEGDFFAPARIIVQNRYVRKWLRLRLARSLGIAVNLSFATLESALWDLLRETDPNQTAALPESVDDNAYRLMVLSVLLEDDDADLAPLKRYLQCDESSLSRLSCRRAWRLADRFGLLIRNYEYDRQDALIQPWLVGRLGLPEAGTFHGAMERAQRALFSAITHEPSGKRALLNRLREKNYKTFPQYAMERMLSPDEMRLPGDTLHFFGFTEISPLHGRAIAWLAKAFDIRVYHWNILAGRIPIPANVESLAVFANGFCETAPTHADDDPGRDLLRFWGRAGAEAIELLAPMVAGGFDIQSLASSPKHAARETASVLGRLHDHLHGRRCASSKLPQDTSIQIVACPGVTREVQTVYDSIVHHLQRDPTLRQTDIGVLTTDMATYRAALQAAFERGAGQLQYNMVDFNAAETSTFAQAVLSMFDLALESFSRSRVFNVLLNPCFLARLGVDRAEAMTWLEWADSLGIHHGWDADEKATLGYARSPRYSWKLGLQRLRLGRYMDVSDENAERPATRFGDVIPFADVESTDRERLDAFCRAVEGLLPALARLRNARMSGKRWADALRPLVNEFLDVPPDRSEEAQARSALLTGLDSLVNWDFLRDSESRSTDLPLALVREFVHGQFKTLPGNQGEYLIGGVTIAELQPMRPIPFEILYIIGLGEALFPGSNTLSSFDLRGAERLPGDIRPAEARTFDFLTAIASAGKKIYLLYNNRDLQRDQALLPSTPLLQLKRHLDDQVLAEPFQEIIMPFGVEDPCFLDVTKQPFYQDVLVQPDATARAASLLEAQRSGRLKLNADQEAEWSRHCRVSRKDFAIAADDQVSPKLVEIVSVRELQRYLRLPAAQSLLRHLRIEDEYEKTIDEHEPLVTSKHVGDRLLRQTLQQIIVAAAKSNVDAAISGWRDRFAQIYADARARPRAPEAAFGEIDEAALASELMERVHGQGGIESFLREHANCKYCGPVLIGESVTPLGARLRFPALRLRPGQEKTGSATEIRIVGSMPLAWHSPQRFEILILSNSDKIKGDKISLAMIEPALFHLALLANVESNADELSSQTWLEHRDFALHLAHPGGILTWTYPAGAITAADALEYLAHLTRDLLLPDQFDLLPFELLAANAELSQAFQDSPSVKISPEDYYAALCDAIENDRENPYSTTWIPLVVDMIHAQAPHDALAKVTRRFRLLDRGPEMLRRQPKAGKARRSAKR